MSSENVLHFGMGRHGGYSYWTGGARSKAEAGGVATDKCIT